MSPTFMWRLAQFNLGFAAFNFVFYWGTGLEAFIGPMLIFAFSGAAFLGAIYAQQRLTREDKDNENG